MSSSIERISFIGWHFNKWQGQFEIDQQSLCLAKEERSRSRDTSFPIFPQWDNLFRNRGAAIPIINILFGISLICKAIFVDREHFFVKEEDELKCRTLCVLVGILEITWIGGLIVHGVASIYFTTTRQSHQELIELLY